MHVEGPTYDQMTRLGQVAEALTWRTVVALREIQSRGPTRISGMAQEVDMAMREAVRKWAKELEQ